MSMDTQRGFTLIELMVVLVIIGIASAAVSLSIKSDPAMSLRKDAERLAKALDIAQAEARADGRPITLTGDGRGFGFRRRADQGAGYYRFMDDSQLRYRTWETRSVRISVEPKQQVVFNAEWIVAPLRIQLSDGQQSLSLQRNALGQLQVVSPP
ncbi:proteinral secretion pathway protein GspH [Pseudomonas syringae pv. philadelphi]|uniref:Type II secretion system protein H n=1 Tax=Pseudomonas syringae pv. philadelphi TaxID=251706 RepID=A0A3M3Z4Y0_9PSED|nr:type II secretion system minor pseudopilin GspH [Pseudomonas syringae group genomosp. 3]RMO89005.1 proteinral secretion pathway protein GspH [Pseudomonas syringae pv. philadelphi]